MLIDVTIPLALSADREAAVALPEQEAASLPFLAGILPSNLRTDLPEMFPPLPGVAVSTGYQWQADGSEQMLTIVPPGTWANRSAEPMELWHDVDYAWEFVVAGVTEKPDAFQSPNLTTALIIRGTAVRTSQSRGGPVPMHMRDDIELEGHFDRKSGRWLDLTIVHTGPGTMTMPDGSKRTMEMGYTNQFIYVSSRAASD